MQTSLLRQLLSGANVDRSSNIFLFPSCCKPESCIDSARESDARSSPQVLPSPSDIKRAMSVSHDHGYLSSTQQQVPTRQLPQPATAMQQPRQMLITNRGGPVQFVNSSAQMGSYAPSNLYPTSTVQAAVYSHSQTSQVYIQQSQIPSTGIAISQPQVQTQHQQVQTQAQYFQQRVVHGNSYNQQPPVTSHLQLNVPVREPTPEPPPAPVVEVAPLPTQPTTSREEEEPEDEEIEIQIRNVVCNYTLPLHIDLRRVALNCNNVTYDRGRGVLLKQKRSPNCYVKIYSSGKVYIVGCRSETDSMMAARGVARAVQRTMGKLNARVAIRNYKVCNVLATCKMPFGINIEEMAKKHPKESQYEPELSIGLVWRYTDPKATLRIHTTGSITVTGATSEAAVMRTIELIYPIVKEFRCASRGKDGARPRPRKRTAPRNNGSAAKRSYGGPVRASGAEGGRVYFSDEEEDIYDDEDLAEV